ncbi:hypothetical protein TruAng_011312 [Truncatella angustata]|nr:hypothetical protein TruAng_011312 [Truncatella angustata]
MANFFSSKNGAYQQVPAPVPMSLEMYVVEGDTLAKTFHALGDSLEQQQHHEYDAYYKALYSHLPKRKTVPGVVPDLTSNQTTCNRPTPNESGVSSATKKTSESGSSQGVGTSRRTRPARRVLRRLQRVSFL